MRFSLMKTVIGMIAAFFCLMPVYASAQIPRENAITAELVSDTSAPGPDMTFTVAILMQPDPGWHGYWLNPGEAGFPDSFEWNLPEGMTIGELRYPVPERLTISGIMNYVYNGDYALLADITVSPDIDLPELSRFTIQASGQWLACTDQVCVPESGDVSLELFFGGNEVVDDRFYDFRQRLPRPLGSEAVFEIVDETLRIGIPFPQSAAISRPYFFAQTSRVLDYSAAQTITRNGDMLVIEVSADSDAALVGRIEGLLKIGQHDGLSLTAMPGDVPEAGAPVSDEPMNSSVMTADIGTILLALGGAILGGLLLNIMPCVFPILSLKALSLVKAGGEERAVRRDALAYTAGVVIVCLGLGAALLALRASGVTAGWAFQLQDPRMILFLLLLVTAIALNLAGLFYLPSISGGGRFADRDGATGSFFTGALAAFVATPCTGPFMGAALGAALIVPTAAALAIFAGLGIGLALPFLILAYIPAFRAKLPKPGPWMEGFRHLMAIPMFLTALALGWVLGRQSGVDGLMLGIAAALGIALMLWWAGNRQVAGKRAWLPIIPAILLTLGALAIVPTSAPAQADAALLNAEPFTEVRLEELRREGTPVFVYFTADWCITCKANEAGAISREVVANHFKSRNIAVLVGDWTNGDPVIGRFLERHGRSGVPLYLYYAPGVEPEILPQILTVGMLTELGN